MAVWLQTRSHVLALPAVATSAVQALPSSQEQEAGGSQVSPFSTIPLPQFAGQSESALVVLVLHPVGQQPSPEAQIVIAVWVQRRSHVLALPDATTSVVQTLPSSQEQEAGGSQVSPFSTIPLPQFAGQSESALVALVLHPAGQQPSPEVQIVIAVWVQATLQLALLPVILSVVHALKSLQLAGQDDGGSQVSPFSTTPLPHFGWQSESLLALHVGGQQPSLPTQTVMAVWLQATLQVSRPPVITSVVQALLSLQLAGQEDFGSQVSPLSTTPLPHFGWQSESLLALHPPGQQPSPALQVLMVVWLQAMLQLALLPVMRSMVQALLSLQFAGQEDTGSQVSPFSTTPLPQVGEQSESALALHPTGQQLSPETQLVMAV